MFEIINNNNMSNTFYSNSSNSNSRHENHVLNGYKMEENTDARSTYTISLRKRENGGLGFLIRQRDEMPYFSIWEIIKNGSADQNGRMKIGDIILRVNNEDISGYSYEKGLELLKSFKPGSLVELTLQSCDPNELNELNNYFKQQKQIEKDGSKINGVMSPLQKLKRKFITCASHNTDFTNSVNNALNNYNTVYDDQSPIYTTTNNEQSKRLNGKYNNSDLEDSGGGGGSATSEGTNQNQMKSNKSNATLSSFQNQNSKSVNNNNNISYNTTNNKSNNETIRNENNSNFSKGNENNFDNNKSTVNNKLNADNIFAINSNFDTINSIVNNSHNNTNNSNNLNNLLKNLSLKEKNQLLEELKKSLDNNNSNNMNNNSNYYNYNNNNSNNNQNSNEQYNNIDASIKSPLTSRKKFYYDNLPNNNSYQYIAPVTYSGTTLRKFNANNQPSFLTSPKLTRQNSNDSTNQINHISHSVSSSLADSKYCNQNEISSKKYSPNYVSSTNSIDSNNNNNNGNNNNESNNNIINKLNNSINIPITAVTAATTTTTTTTTTAKLNRNIQFNTTDIYEPVVSKVEPATIKSVKMSTTTTSAATAALASLPTNFSNHNETPTIPKSPNNDKIRSQTLTSLNKIGQENDSISNNKYNSNNVLNKSTSLSRCPIDGGFSQALAIKNSDTLSLEDNLSDQQRQQSLSNLNSPKTMPKTNTIQIIQDGDDIRISIDGNIEILTNRSTDRRIISLSPQCSRKSAINQSNEQLNDYGSVTENNYNNINNISNTNSTSTTTVNTSNSNNNSNNATSIRASNFNFFKGNFFD